MKQEKSKSKMFLRLLNFILSKQCGDEKMEGYPSLSFHFELRLKTPLEVVGR
jgi:hypothetical protein